MKNLIYASLILVIVGLLFFTNSNSGDTPNDGGVESWGTTYYKAGTINIYDPRMGAYGTVDSDKALMHFNLVDIAKVAGHLCGGTTSGFLMTKLALESLYGKDIPVRGDIRLSADQKGDTQKVAAYIIGASEEQHYGFQTWITDASMKPEKGDTLLIFERISTGKKVKLLWHKTKTINEHTGDSNRFDKMKLKTIHGLASDAEAKEFHGLLNSLVLKMADGGVKYDLEVLNQGKSIPTAMEGCKCHDALK